jgi:phosphoribosylformylglycinamidine synthase subunit PurL
VVGLLDDATLLSTQWFKAAGHRVALLGPETVSLGGSEYLHVRHDQVGGRLAPLDLEIERRVQAAVRAAIGAGLTSATHDCSEGGVAAALAEACVSGRTSIGCEVTLAAGPRADHVLFGEGPSRIVVSVEPERAREFEALMAESAIPWRWIGTTGGDRLRVSVGTDPVVDVGLDQIGHAWRNGFERHMA